MLEVPFDPALLILLAAGAYVGWNIGANDTANCIGTTVGAGLLSFRRAVLVVAVFALLGALLQGQHVMDTIGKGIVHQKIDFLAVCVALVSAGSFVTLATLMRIPTSTSQAIVGGVVGIGLAIHAPINTAKFWTIVGSWVLCPVLVMLLAYGLSHLIGLILNRVAVSILIVQQIMGGLAIVSGGYVAYSMGANNVGDAVGPIASLDIFPPILLLALGGGAIAGGAITYGRRVAETVGKGITTLDVRGAFVAQAASAAGIHLFSVWGIPVSTSSAIVGAVVGVGLVKGARAISKKTIFTILIGWMLTPCLAAFTSFTAYRLITRAFLS
jgi:inorganic phosphate transporter, PiT family